MSSPEALEREALKSRIRALGRGLGFDAVGFSGIDLAAEEAALSAWLAAGYHGEMDYMVRHGARRARPGELVPGTVSVITARVDYLAGVKPHPPSADDDAGEARVSVYAWGRDYHKVLRGRLRQLALAIEAEVGAFGHRVFTDSAPVMEVALGVRGGLGWRGKHTLLLSREAGSYFFLGEIYTDLDLPPDAPQDDHCGACFACAEACPTGAITAPYRLDARRCISYLTIELKGAIPEDLRPLVGNRIYGCDDCQAACPWNKYARVAALPDFRQVRNGLDRARLTDLFAWSEAEFASRMAGSAILRIGHAKWLSNIAVALGNALAEEADPARAANLRAALLSRADHPDDAVRESVGWALGRAARTEP
ncbi:MAG: tRNA epoxyqueuosine(34) reductase QueG [Burkholderiales bacterium]|nr:tRNA epoxyqueuosine(34) reductase QueG [Burkholderiales bacterium]